MFLVFFSPSGFSHRLGFQHAVAAANVSQDVSVILRHPSQVPLTVCGCQKDCGGRALLKLMKCIDLKSDRLQDGTGMRVMWWEPKVTYQRWLYFKACLWCGFSRIATFV